MTLTEVCLLTLNVRCLRDFYRQLLQVEPVDDGEVHVAFQVGDVFLTLYAAGEMEAWAPGSTREVGRGGGIVGFEVADVDQEYARLLDMRVTILKVPTTFPWGRRAVWFQDPDGNKITFSCPILG